MSGDDDHGSTRREFLERLATTAVYVSPLFVTAGARAEESAACQRAKGFLKEARELVARARKASSDDTRRRLAMDAESELTEARSAAREAKESEREDLAAACEAVARDIDELLGDD